MMERYITPSDYGFTAEELDLACELWNAGELYFPET